LFYKTAERTMRFAWVIMPQKSSTAYYTQEKSGILRPKPKPKPPMFKGL